ncbi:MAG: peptide chain release factor N(5)-glutamine methyltransferase [Syntrophus sp. (in: bacteria)]|nr:peptide chain release factor N(5)-glutamine methyltransferase [Syntrophus sp. (in: bacteria)]
MNVREIILRERQISMTDVLSIISFVCATSKEQTLASMTKEIDDTRFRDIESCIDERKRGKPLAYITEKKEFYSQEFYVDGNVLVPRPETEILVEEALSILGQQKNITGILDMGTGSGAIGLTIAQRAEKRVVCADVSWEALVVAKKNARMLGVLERVSFLCSNLFGGVKEGTKFDMILANLPYIGSEEWDALMPDVKNFEPRKALYGGKDGVEIYRAFLQKAHLYLRNKGYLLCEIGGARQANLVKNILESAGFEVAIKNDYSGEERVLIGSWINLS